jgi:FkbM family methyltransferase
MEGDNVKVVYADGTDPVLKGIKYFMRGRRGRAFVLRHLLNAFPGLNNASLCVDKVLIPLDLTLDADIGYFYDDGIGHEEFYQQVLLALVERDTVFYDVGSNLGYYSFLLAGRVRQVYAFEPNPQMVSRIRGVIDTFHLENVMISPIGLGDSRGVLDYYLDPSRHNLGSFLPGKHDFPHQKIEVTSLDEFISTNQAILPTIIKIDTEGFELKVLEGYSGLLEHLPVVILEWISAQDNEAERLSELGKIANGSYELFKIGHAHKLVPLAVSGFTDYSNLLLLPKGSDFMDRIRHWISK